MGALFTSPVFVGIGLTVALTLGALVAFTGGRLAPSSSRRHEGSVATGSQADTSQRAGALGLPKRESSLPTLRLTVLDADTGQPVQGVVVTASNHGKRLGQAKTDRQGLCAVPRPNVEQADFYYELRAKSDGYVTREISWSRFQMDALSDIPSEYLLRMNKGLRVGGSVIDDSGQAVPGIQITVRARGIGGVTPRERPTLMHGVENFVSDQSGKWVFDRLPTEWDSVHFIISAPEYQKADYISDASDEVSPNQYQIIGKKDLLEERAIFTVHSGMHVTGLVLDAHNQPVPGATLVRDLHFYELAARSSAGPDGSYEILNARLGPLTLIVQAPGYAPKTVELKPDGPMTNANITLDKGAQVQGHVVDERGTNVPLAEIEVDRAGGPGQKFEWSTTGSPDGWFEWDSAPAEGFAAVVSKLGFVPKHVWLKPNVAETVVLSKSSPDFIQVEGRVVDEDRQEPIPVFRFSLSEENHGFGPPKEGRDGAFSVKLSGTGQSLAIQVDADGYEPVQLAQSMVRGEIPRLTFKLRRASGYTGTVLLPDGQPAVDAEVGISDGGRSLMLGERKFLFKEESIIHRTDANGGFHFGPRPAQMPSGRVIVAIHPQGFAECEADPPERVLVLPLQAWGRVQGVLRSHGRPLANEEVYLNKRFWNPWLPAVDLMPAQFAVKTDSEGRFQFESVPPGDHALCRQPFHSLDIRATLGVRPGETTQVEVGGTGQSVAGRIVIPDFREGFDFSQSRGILKREQVAPVDLPRVARKDYPSDEAYQAAARENGAQCVAYWQSAAGLDAWRQQKSYGVRFDPDGTFHADDVVPGEYTLNVFIEEPVPGSPGQTRTVFPWRTSTATIHVDSAHEGQQWVDVGSVVLKSKF